MEVRTYMKGLVMDTQFRWQSQDPNPVTMVLAASAYPPHGQNSVQLDLLYVL